MELPRQVRSHMEFGSEGNSIPNTSSPRARRSRATGERFLFARKGSREPGQQVVRANRESGRACARLSLKWVRPEADPPEII